MLTPLAAGLTKRPPVDTVDKGYFIGPLDRRRVDKGPPVASVGVRQDALLHSSLTSAELVELCRLLLGRREMEEFGERWSWRAYHEPRRLRQVLLDLRESLLGSEKIRRPGAYAEKLWRRGQT